jgi:hypothetical protein
MENKNNKRKLSGDSSSKVAVVIPPMRDSHSNQDIEPPNKRQKTPSKAIEHIEIPSVSQSKPSEMAKPRMGRPEHISIPPFRLPNPAGLFQTGSTSATVPKTASTEETDSTPPQPPSPIVPQVPFASIIHRLERAASPGHIDNVPVILPAVQNTQQNPTNVLSETDGPSESPQRNQASSRTEPNSPGGYTAQPVLSPNMESLASLNLPDLSPQIPNRSPVVILRDSIALIEAEQLVRQFYARVTFPPLHFGHGHIK